MSQCARFSSCIHITVIKTAFESPFVSDNSFLSKAASLKRSPNLSTMQWASMSAHSIDTAATLNPRAVTRAAPDGHPVLCSRRENIPFFDLSAMSIVDASTNTERAPPESYLPVPNLIVNFSSPYLTMTAVPNAPEP